MARGAIIRRKGDASFAYKLSVRRVQCLPDFSCVEYLQWRETASEHLHRPYWGRFTTQDNRFVALSRHVVTQ